MNDARVSCCDFAGFLCMVYPDFEERLLKSPNKSQLGAWFRSTPYYRRDAVLYGDENEAAFLKISPRYDGFAFAFPEDPEGKGFRITYEQLFYHCRPNYS
jgi:hypothetical protein